MILKLADTTLARWLAKKMSQATHHETDMPGISQRYLSQQIDVSQSQLSDILKNGHVPQPNTLFVLADYFDTPYMTMLGIAYLGVENGQ